MMVNKLIINKVIIDPHYEDKHSESINDKIILMLVDSLNEKFFDAETVSGPYSYFVNDKINLDGKLYKLIWLLEENEIYIGIVNEYRR